MYTLGEKRFLVTNLITIVTLFTLILAGGVVRSSGSGMGCPDWPKCFGQYIPPTHISQLPIDYQKKYVAKRIAKNERFAKTLDLLGYGEIADRIRNDKTILQPEEFNVAKTWTEYINRLIGVVCGVLILACLGLSLFYLKLSKRIFILSLLNVLLVIFQAWLGSLVVSTNLLSWIVTVHMLCAMVIVGISIYTYFYASHLNKKNSLVYRSSPFLSKLSIFIILLSMIQIGLGTQVREEVDVVVNNLNRLEWMSAIGLNFVYHRDLSILITLSNIILFLIIKRRYTYKDAPFKYGVGILFILLLQIIAGLILSYFALPPAVQAAHIVLASLLFGGQFYLMLLLNGKE